MTEPDVRFPAASLYHSHSATYQFSTCPDLQFMTYIYSGKSFGDVDSGITSFSNANGFENGVNHRFSRLPLAASCRAWRLRVTAGGVGDPLRTLKIGDAGTFHGKFSLIRNFRYSLIHRSDNVNRLNDALSNCVSVR